ncbi:SET domain-containing protein [Marasmius fiardii PR-910]|nr:SET domain-containing protein [Marasmius fiardii PR-910]
MSTSSSDLSQFLSWFQRSGGSYDSSSISFKDFDQSEGGRGAVALKDIPEDHVLFAIPRSLTLSTHTSSLPNLFGAEFWKRHKLDEGWAGLILCMMWETAQGSASHWAEYLGTLPREFDTPMFWSAGELEELKGTSITDKLGKEDAERDYNEKVLPAVRSHPDVFTPELISVHYTLEQYHIMGSRILSRSFDVERWESEEDGNNTTEAANTSTASAIDVDTPASPERESTPEEEEEEDPIDVSMVPMADLLNARYGSENAKLFHEEKELRMVSTKQIRAGEQIWNTYGDLPNAELIRRYGHIDLLPLPQGGVGNPGDVVEIRADLVVAAAESVNAKERIDWYLEEGGDDILIIESEGDIPELMILLIRLLILPNDEWKNAKQKRKLPKAKANMESFEIASRVLENRLSQYPTSIKDDEGLLKEELSKNTRHAIMVRLGEKKILCTALEKVKAQQIQLQAAEQGNRGNGSKRKRPEANSGRKTKARK